MNPWLFPKFSFKIFYSVLFISFVVKLIALNLLTYEQINKMVFESRKKHLEKSISIAGHYFLQKKINLQEGMINTMIQ